MTLPDAYRPFCGLSIDRAVATASAFRITLQPRQDLRPALMARARAFAGKARVGEPHRGDAVVLVEFEAHQRLRRLLVPARQPGEGEHARAFDDSINAADRERLAAHADAAHQPTPVGPQIGLHVFGL